MNITVEHWIEKYNGPQYCLIAKNYLPKESIEQLIGELLISFK